MKIFKINQIRWIFFLAVTIGVNACQKSDNPNNLPSVNPADYEGKVDGYDSSDQIFPNNLKAYWSFDDNTNEKKSNTAVTQTANATLSDGGVRGKALSLNAGFLYFDKAFEAFKTDNFKSFTVSVWVQILNNGSKKTMVFQLARPGIFNGNINFVLETNLFPASEIDQLKIHPTFTNLAGTGTQDNINTKRDNPGDPNYVPYLTPKIGADKWTHLLLSYETTTGMFDIWADGVKVGAYPGRGVGAATFKSHEPNEVIIGGNYNVIPGKTVNADVSFAPMTGRIDEIRIYDKVLPQAYIKALYNLGKAGK